MESWPRLPFRGYSTLLQEGNTPYIIVDGSPEACRDSNAVLVLTHSPGNNIRPLFKADLSTQIAFKYMEQRTQWEKELKTAKAVTNDHMDVDGLLGCFVFYDPPFALQHRDLLEEAASAGDFNRTLNRTAARINFVFEEMETEELKSLQHLDYLGQTARLYEFILPQVRDVVENLDRYQKLWLPQDTRLANTEKAIEQGLITIKDDSQHGLTIVRVLSADIQPDDVHQMAIHNRTTQFATLYLHPDLHHYYLNYRYESYVDYQSVNVTRRVNLAGLAVTLNAKEEERKQGDQPAAKWVYDDALSYKTFFKMVNTQGSSSPSAPLRSALSAEEFEEALISYLHTGQGLKSNM